MVEVKSNDWMELVNRLDTFEMKTMEQFAIMGSRFDKGESRLDKVENRLDKVENKLDKVENRLDKVENRLGKVENRLDKVENRLGSFEKRTEERFNKHDRNFEILTEAVLTNREMIHQQGILAEARDKKIDHILELLQGHIEMPPSQEEISNKLENHEVRITGLEVKWKN